MKGIQGGMQLVRMTYRMSSSSDSRFVSLNLSFTEWIVQALALDDDFDVSAGIPEVRCQYGTNNNVKVIRDEDDYQNEFLPRAREAGSFRVELHHSVSCIPSYNIIMLINLGRPPELLLGILVLASTLWHLITNLMT